MNKYELLLTLPGTLDDTEVAKELEKALEVVKKYAENPEVDSLGKIRLAYPVKQIRYGYYYTVVFETEPENAPKINNKLRLNKTLLRAIVNTYNPKAKKPSLTVGSINTSKTEVKEKVSLSDVMEEKEEKPVEKKTMPKKEEQNVDLKDIDKKLDEILDSEMVSGV